ncbi:hypothetical protein PAPHI01_1942 [Pancytospora philotis]|nr:hypothetical protein PAPHI01_1942 [Pancytospora philotis]
MPRGRICIQVGTKKRAKTASEKKNSKQPSASAAPALEEQPAGRKIKIELTSPERRKAAKIAAQDPAGHAEMLKAICRAHQLPFSGALALKFGQFYADVVEKLKCRDDNVVRIYANAMVYKYTKTALPKKGFLGGCKVKVFDKALGTVGGWLGAYEERVESLSVGFNPVCNLYAIVQHEDASE